LNVTQRKSLNEQARSKSEICDKCEELGALFIAHFDKVFNNPTADEVNHWITEMEAWVSKCRSMRFKHNNKQVSLVNMIDWFFTCSKSVDDLFSDAAEIDAYNSFIEEYINTKDIKQAFINCGII